MAQLLDADGQRKYVCWSETELFLDAADRMDEPTRVFCHLLVYTGCRISEALALTGKRLDAETGRVVFQTLKRRSDRVFRAVPVPPELMRALRKLARGRDPEARLWEWTRTTGWRRTKAVMFAAGISGTKAMPKGLRHGFCILNAEANIPATTTRDWVGHARLETLSIYQHAVGREEVSFAKRVWRRLDRSGKGRVIKSNKQTTALAPER